MAAGLCAAWPFRKTWLEEQEPALIAPVQPQAIAASPPLLPAKRTEVRPDETSPAVESEAPDITPAIAGLHPLTSALERGVAQRPLVKIDRAPELPALASDYSLAEQRQLDPRSAILADEGSAPVMTENAPPELRRYRIGKHDTLESIAERLLGSPQHADKLLAANREVILVPEVLPVGATIVIPQVALPAETIVRRPGADM